MRDPSWLEKYRATVPSLVARHGGKYLVRGNVMETLEGTMPLPSAMVMIEFPSMDAGKAFFTDPEYAPFIKLRQAGSDVEMVLVQGL